MTKRLSLGRGPNVRTSGPQGALRAWASAGRGACEVADPEPRQGGDDSDEEHLRPAPRRPSDRLLRLVPADDEERRGAHRERRQDAAEDRASGEEERGEGDQGAHDGG